MKDRFRHNRPWIYALLLTACFALNGYAGQNEEFRAFWVITWEHISGSRTVEQNKARVREILDRVAESNMNAVLWQARQSGTAYYVSSYEPWGSYAGGSYPGYDPLAYAIEEGHKRGIEVHAWFNCFHASSTVAGTPAAEHPEWVCRDQDGNPMISSRALSPGLAEVRAYTIEVAMEIVRNYDIDGLHLDYVRWNEYTNSKTSQTMAGLAEMAPALDGEIPPELLKDLEVNQAGRYLYDYQHPYNAGIPDSVDGGRFPSWEDWWRWSVTEFVRVLHDSVQAVKPWVRLSPAALGKYNWSGWQGYGVVYQDAALWFNEGYIEQLTPMHYHWLTGSDFYNVLAGPGTENWGYWIIPGIAAGRLFTAGPGSYRLDEENVWDNHPDIIAACRAVDWVDGQQFFSFNWWEKHNYWQEAAATFYLNKTKIRATKLIDDSTPETPVLAFEKADSITYRVTVTPPQGLDRDQWFLIYRSGENTVAPDSASIVHRAFGREPVIFTDRFDGSQPYSPRYYFAATMCDRYWNESGLSDIVMTDSIPYLPPVIVPPATPDNIRVLATGSTTLTVVCDTVAMAEHYVVYYGSDGVSFPDSIAAGSNYIEVPDLPSGQPCYMKIRARNAAGSSEFARHTYAGAPGDNYGGILIVNGFERPTNTRYDYIKFYGGPVATHGGAFSYALNTAVEEQKILLNDFQTVIWYLGDESTADETFNAQEQALVADFLKNGGSLFVSGAEIGWDLVAKGTTADQAFYRQYLKAQYISDAPNNTQSGYYSAEPVSGSVFAGMDPFDFDDGSHGTIDVDWPDAVRAIDGSADVLKFKDLSLTAGGAGIAYSGIFSGGTKPGKLVYLSIPYETIYPENVRMELMQRVLDYFSGMAAGIEDLTAAESTPAGFELAQNYPNPFNPVTAISFTIDQPGRTRLRVFDTVGRLVETLIDKDLKPGRYEVIFEAKTLASGVYICVLQNHGRQTSIKMMMVK